MNKHRKIELLAPAKTAEIGRQAIIHGADAVYIGAPEFGARAAAGNPVEEIARLCDFAHGYGASVYVALNTLLTDEELSRARRLVWELYRAGADALIVQDVGITQLDLPPMALHASTQMDNCTPAKVRFLQQNGFSRVVLARELSLAQIGEIADETDIPLEVFIHGALCVSYSGRCYLSQAACGRSANRGACAQYCRLPYTLTDGDGTVLVRDKHLLSLRDLNRSAHLEALLDAGVTSLKIEGRLKEMDYVKNITAHYRLLLDQLFDRRPEFKPESSGRVELDFRPNPSKSFNRGFTSYYLHGRGGEEVTSFDTPKSVGERVGTVKSVERNAIRVAGVTPLHNGDGLCFFDSEGSFHGFRVNRVDQNLIYPNEMPRITPRTVLYRNSDHEFEKQLSGESARRWIEVKMRLRELLFGYSLELEDADGRRVELTFQAEKQEAKRPQKEQIAVQLGKLGGTIFRATHIEVDFQTERFIPLSQLNEWRRQGVERLIAARLREHRPVFRPKKMPVSPVLSEHLDYTANVMNRESRVFYRNRGVIEMAPAYELAPPEGAVLMFSKHCLKYSLGLCPKQKGSKPVTEPLELSYRELHLSLKFDCGRCEMQVKLSNHP